VTAKSSAMAESMAVFHSTWYRLVLLILAVFLTVAWSDAAPSNPGYALVLALATASLEPAIPFAIVQLVPRRWLHVPRGEGVLHRIVGIGIFGRLLDLIGWNNLIRPMRGFTGTRAGLLALQEHARFGAVAHAICFAIHAALAVLALFAHHPWRGALWMLWPALILHFYPTLLQRSIMLRIQPLLDRTDRPGPVPNSSVAP
jgi:hypothetical protein